MKYMIRRLMLIAGLITGVLTIAIMGKGNEPSTSTEIATTGNGAIINQLAVTKGTQWIIQTAYKLLQTN